MLFYDPLLTQHELNATDHLISAGPSFDNCNTVVIIMVAVVIIICIFVPLISLRMYCILFDWHRTPPVYWVLPFNVTGHVTSEGTPPAVPALLGDIRLGELPTQTRYRRSYKQVDSRL